MRGLKNLLVTGGSGFIGANFIRYLFNTNEFTGRIVNLDKLTYAGNPTNLADIAEEHSGVRYEFVHGDICDAETVLSIFSRYDIDAVVHFAAESHVDRSIFGPKAFIDTNINGTFNLLEAARNAWADRDDVVFHHVSTDEVFGSLGTEGAFTEESPYEPRSPYSASKAGSDHLVRAYHHTFNLPVTITNCTNNYGPYQFPEKLIPVVINNLLEGTSVPVYGDGRNIRDWLYVKDHCSAIWDVITHGAAGHTYGVGGENEWENISLVRELCRIMNERRPRPSGNYEDLITFITDRPGHDRRYAIDCSKIKKELGWERSVSFSEGLERTVDWYLANLDWLNSVKTGEYRNWIEHNYSNRKQHS